MNNRRIPVSKGFRARTNLLEFIEKSGISVSKLAEIAGCSYMGVIRLQEGVLSPFHEKNCEVEGEIYKRGDIKKTAGRMASFFGVDISELFPDDYARVEGVNNCFMGGSDSYVSLGDLKEESDGGNFVDGLEREVGFHNLFGMVNGKLTSRENNILEMYFYDDLTREEIGEFYGITAVRVRQIEKKALRKIRGSLHFDKKLELALKELIV